ncbi:MAG: hypothetical protein O2954_17460 [bacterium]|nr:hypothetical protein [bacterium]
MNILGINTGRNTAAALIQDGEILALAEEERFIREKGTSKFPRHSVAYCLEVGGISLEEVDYITYPYDRTLSSWPMIKVFLRYFPKTLQAAWVQLQKVVTPSDFTKELSTAFGVPLAELKKKVVQVEHHVAHAAVVFYTSGFDSASVLSMDGIGEYATTLWGRAEGTTFTKLDEVHFPYSVGLLYNTVTQFLGFRIDSGEGKVMGLAPYGTPKYMDEFSKIVWPTENGRFAMDMSYFRYHYTADKTTPFYSNKFTKLFGPPRVPESEMTQHYTDLAATLQEMTERLGVHFAKNLYERAPNENLCVGGGVALNSVMNFKILRETPFKNIAIYPASHDGGTAAGSALFLYFNKLGNPRKPVTQSAYLGPEYSDTEIEEALKENGLAYERLEEDALVEKTAGYLKDQRIIGWFQGRIEVGPRALGNRSILCAPFPAEMKDILNHRVKRREGFRPFAPVAPIERYEDFFEIDAPSPHMLLVCDVKKDRIKDIPAVTHVDDTARLQTITQEQNPRYWKLVQAFDRLTGIPVLVNTSFNVRGEPIVCTPSDAIRCYLGTNIDVLVVGNYVVRKVALGVG